MKGKLQMRYVSLIISIVLLGSISLQAQTAYEYAKKGEQAFDQEEFEMAIAYYTLALKQNPEYKEIYILRALARIPIGRYGPAIEDCNAAQLIDPSDARVYSIRGAARAQLDQYLAAFEDLDKAISMNPDQAELFYMRATVRFELRDFRAAIEDFNRAIQIYDSSPYSSETAYGRKEAMKYRQKALDALNSQVKTVSNAAQTHIISVGIATYQDSLFSQLKGPVDQAYQFARICQNAGFVQHKVTILSNEHATRTAILDTIRRQFCDPKMVGPNDLVVFYFSGHGTMVDSKAGICPYDFEESTQLIPDEELIALMQSSPARHKVCFIEACKSKLSMSGIPILTEDEVYAFHQARLQIREGLIYITSSEVEKPSIELPHIGGVFSHYLFRGMRGDADRDQDKRITSRELFDYLTVKITQKTDNQQIPQINTEGYERDIPIFQLK